MAIPAARASDASSASPAPGQDVADRIETDAPSSDWWGAGPLFDEFKLTLSPGHRTEALGPFYYQEEGDTQRTWAVPPVLSYARDPGTELEEFDFLYPLMSYDRYGSQHRWQFFEILSFAGGPTQRESDRNRFTLFPFYFQQRSTDPGEDYTAVFPFYGHLKHRLFRDEIFFVMFPVYGESRKRDVVTDNYLYPFFHLRHGDGLHGWQFWPIVGQEHKDVATRTNGFNEVQTVGGHDQYFVLWPFFIDQNTGIGTTNPSWQQLSFPFYSLERSPNRDSTYALWLFGHADDREKKYREWDLPWPLIVFARGTGKTTSRVWPLFSQAHSATRESDFYLWPAYKYGRYHGGALDRERNSVFFFLYSDLIEKDTETKASRRRVYLWPLFIHHRDFNGNSRLQVLAPLEPFLPTAHKIERDYSPLWSLWRAEKNPHSGAASQSLLWNLYRHDATPDSQKYSALFGLYQYRSDAAGKSLRLFYIPVSKSKPRNF